MKTLGWTISALGLMLAVGACSTPEPVDETVQGTLTDDDSVVEDDNSPYDDYQFDAGEGWTIEITMSSTDFDTYLWLIGPDRASLVQNDDISPQDRNSRISHTTTTSGTYTVRANSFDGSGRGAYELHYTASPN